MGDHEKPSAGSRACLACRKVKMRCHVGDLETICERCVRKSVECVFQEHRRGRKRGTRIVKKTAPTPAPPSHGEADGLGRRPDAAKRPSSQGGGFDARDLQPPSLLNHAATQGRFSLHTVLNPVTDESAAPSQSRAAAARMPEQDPIQLGYINSTIAESLFSHFINVLNPYICQLDPLLHTIDYVRQRSAFLFTAVLAVAAKTFGSSTYRVLYDHAETLMAACFRRGDKSVEIAQAIMVTTYWKEPADTRAWLSLGYVIRMGMDLGWHLLKPPAVAAACPVGGGDSTKERELRNIQRTWYVLFVYDHSMSLQTGKPWMIERNEFIQSIDDWCRQPLAADIDRLLGAFVSLRLLGSEVFQLLRSNAGRMQSDAALHNSEPLLNLLEAQLDRWEQRWVPRMAGDERHGFMVRFYGMHLRLQLFSLFLPRVLAAAARHSSDGTVPANLRILWTCYASALEMLELLCRSAECLFFAQDSIHVMTAYSAAFLVKLLKTAPESIAPQIEAKVVQVIQATARVFSLQAAPPTSSRALQARFLDQILASLAQPSRGREQALASNPEQHQQPDGLGHGGASAFPVGGDVYGHAAGIDHGAGQPAPLDWLLEQHDASSNLFAFAGFDLEAGVFFA